MRLLPRHNKNSPRDISRPVRIVPELRSNDVKRGHTTTAVDVFYFGQNFDLGQTAIPSNYIRLGVLHACWRLFISRAQVLETAEPLWVRFAPKNFLLVGSWKIGGLVRRMPRYTVCFAMENNDLDAVIFGHARISHFVRRAVRACFSSWIGWAFDRIAFG